MKNIITIESLGMALKIRQHMEDARTGRPSACIGTLDGGDTTAVGLLLCIPRGPSVTESDWQNYQVQKAKFLGLMADFEAEVKVLPEAPEAAHAG